MGTVEVVAVASFKRGGESTRHAMTSETAERTLCGVKIGRAALITYGPPTSLAPVNCAKCSGKMGASR